MSGNTPPILLIGDLLVSPEIITEFFRCDYGRCRGACCIIGESGAPLAPGEEALLQSEYKHYAELMSPEGREAAEKGGFAVIDADSDCVTPLLGESEACIYTHFEPVAEEDAAERAGAAAGGGAAGNGITEAAGKSRGHAMNCLCAVELAYLSGKCRFAKPISCRLYPIRVHTFPDGSRGLNLHRWDICRDAFRKGKKEGVRVYQFLKKPLIDAFGPDFYEALEEAARTIR